MISKIKLIHLIIVYLCFSKTNSLTKKWIHDINYDNPNNWNKNEVPCPKEEIIFPQGLFSVVDLPKFLEFKTLVLPNDGALIMNENSKIGIGADGSVSDECKNRKGEIKFNPSVSEPWFLSKNWRALEGSMEVHFNPAVPHQEIIPCDYDTIIFPNDNSISVDVQDVPKILFNRVEYRGISNVHAFVAFTNTQLGRMVIKNSDTTYLHSSHCYISNSENDCSCHTSLEKHGLMEALCENERKYCETPECTTPIKPEGHCCNICGSLLHIPDNRLKDFKRIVNNYIQDNHRDEFHVHMSLVNIDEIPQIQLIVLEKERYMATSLKFVEDLKPLLSPKFNAEKMTLIGAGLPYRPNDNNVWTIIFGSLFVTTAFFFLIYVFYEREEKQRVLNWISNVRHNRIFSSDTAPFARFDNAAMGNEFENVHVGLETNPGSVTDLTATSAFKNPIYEGNNMEDEKEEKTKPTNFNEAFSYKKSDDTAVADTPLEEINIIDDME